MNDRTDPRFALCDDDVVREMLGAWDRLADDDLTGPNAAYKWTFTRDGLVRLTRYVRGLEALNAQKLANAPVSVRGRRVPDDGWDSRRFAVDLDEWAEEIGMYAKDPVAAVHLCAMLARTVQQ